VVKEFSTKAFHATGLTEDPLMIGTLFSPEPKNRRLQHYLILKLLPWPCETNAVRKVVLRGLSGGLRGWRVERVERDAMLLWRNWIENAAH
jgi:hypothetical protein